MLNVLNIYFQLDVPTNQKSLYYFHQEKNERIYTKFFLLRLSSIKSLLFVVYNLKICAHCMVCPMRRHNQLQPILYRVAQTITNRTTLLCQ